MGSAMKLVTWSLATFHATAFVLAIVLFAYSRDALGTGLSGLNTFVGLGLFVALWATTTSRPQRRWRVLISWDPPKTGTGTCGGPCGAAHGMGWRSLPSSASSPWVSRSPTRNRVRSG